jgi:hypothetical protein
MAGAAVTEYLAAKDYARFVAIVRRYSHDVMSRFNNLVIATEVCSKLLRNRSAQYLIIPIGAEDAAQMFDALRNQSLVMPNEIRRFVWGDDPDNRDACEAVTRDWWHPYDAGAWDSFVNNYARFVGKQLQPIDAMVEEIERWAASGVLTPPDQCEVFLNTLRQIRETLDAVWAMLTPAAAEARIMPVIEAPAE